MYIKPVYIDRIPGRSKLMMIIFYFTFMASLAVNIAEIFVFDNSNCEDKSVFWTYFDFALMIVLKIVTLCMVNLELIKTTPYT